ncbi:MAG: hypothetical protein Fur002_17130 [Anaerolineales bacterium]
MSPPNASLLPNLGSLEPQGTSMFLDAQQTRLRERKACGLIQIQTAPAQTILQLFAQGVAASAYLQDGDSLKPFQFINLLTVWNGAPAPIRVAEFSPHVGRLLWLALESPIAETLDLAGKAALQEQLARWRADAFNGVAQMVGADAQSAFIIKDGSPLAEESFTLNGETFSPALPFDGLSDSPLRLLIRRFNPASQAYQCLALRLGVTGWGRQALSRYEELAGQRLTQMLQLNVRQVCQPSDWNLSIEGARLRDEHFFSYAQTAAQAYRAVFMEVGAQMEQVVGGALAQRILTETFSAVSQDTRAALELHRLIPAAFIG